MTLEDWFEKWWFSLPKHHFTSNNKGSKARCLQEVKKLNPDQELRDKIDWYTRELTLRTTRIKQEGMRVAGWKHAERLIRYTFWIDELPSVSDSREKVESSMCSCGKKTQITNQCWDCYEKDHPRSDFNLRGEFIRLGLMHNESTTERKERCRDWLRQKGYLGTVIPE